MTGLISKTTAMKRDVICTFLNIETYATLFFFRHLMSDLDFKYDIYKKILLPVRKRISINS